MIPLILISATLAAALSCAPGPAVRLHIDGFKDEKGQVLVQLYGNAPEDFLAKGKKLARLTAPVPANLDIATICLAVPAAGEYALIVIHDRDGDGKADAFSEGFGLPNTDKMKLRRPKYQEGRFTIGDEVIDMTIGLNYLTGNGKRHSEQR